MASPAALSVMDAPFGQAVSSSPGLDLSSPVSVLLKDASKRKRVNRNARLKQCKLDARREQWLSQVTSMKHGKDRYRESPSPEKDDTGDVDIETRTNSSDLQHYNSKKSDRSLIFSHLHLESGEVDEQVHVDGEKSSPSASSSCTFDGSEACFSPASCGSESPMSKVTRVGKDYEWVVQESGSEKSLQRVDSQVKNSDKDYGHGSPMGYSSGSSSTGKVGEQVSESEEDDWEAVADALGVDQSKVDSPKEEVVVRSPHVEHVGFPAATGSDVISKCGQISRCTSGKAWRPDDACRPATLPNISKQQSLPIQLTGQIPQWMDSKEVSHGLSSGPSICPICAEELDTTDSSFESCVCGFQLCLFCHHRIASEDGRCPGCRRPYSTANGVASLC